MDCRFIIRILVVGLFSSALAFNALAASPEGPIYLWKGYKVSNGRDVKLYAYRPQTPNGVGIIVCPGGSYYWLDEDGEGHEVGKWLAENGYTAFVLFYRTAGRAEIAWHTRLIFKGVRHPDMIADAQRALQYVYEYAPFYDLDRNRIGMLGFSAGGHLVMSAACFSSTDFLEAEGIVTQADLRPAFVAPIYPVVTMNKPYVHVRSRRGLLGDSKLGNKTLLDSLSLENHIPSDCPPVFTINCKDDPVVPYMNSVLLDSALTANRVSHRYIQYETGKHGFGVSDHYGSPQCREWKDEFLKWLGELYFSSR